MKNIGELLNKLQKVQSHGSYYTALCPAHADKVRSLSLKQEDGKTLIKCHAGCSSEDIVNAIDMNLSDLFIDNGELSTPPEKSRIVATYDYQDESGNLLYQTVRLQPKNFFQRHRNGNNEWVNNLEGVRRVLYHLPELLKVSPEETVYIVEGEKDADNLWSWGLIATTSPMGAGKWQSDYANALKGKRVVVIPDHDAPGHSHGKDIIRSLSGKAAEIKCILLDKEKDISEWIDSGHDIEELAKLEQPVSALFSPDNPLYQPEGEAIVWHRKTAIADICFKANAVREEKTGIHARISILCDYNPLAWGLFNVERSEDRTRLANQAHGALSDEMKKQYGKEDIRRDLDNFCAGLWDYTLTLYSPELVGGDDTQAPPTYILYPYVIEGGGSILFAPAGRGKSFTGLLWAVSVDQGVQKFWRVTKCPVLFINLERSKKSIQRRLAAVNKILGLSPLRQLHMINARGKSLQEISVTCKRYIREHDIKCIVLDSISRAGYGDLNENRPVNVIVDSLNNMCSTWVALAHTPRADETHLFGSVHFEAGADVVVRLATEVKDDGTLGIGWEITKSNDVPQVPQQIWALEFNEIGLSGFRKAGKGEFLEVESKKKKNVEQNIIEWLQDRDNGDATATEIAAALGLDQSNVSRIFNKPGGRFIKTRKEGRNQYYGVKF